MFHLQKSSWIISVELAIGPEEGISYLTDKGCNVSLLRRRLGAACSPTHLTVDLAVDGGVKLRKWHPFGKDIVVQLNLSIS